MAIGAVTSSASMNTCSSSMRGVTAKCQDNGDIGWDVACAPSFSGIFNIDVDQESCYSTSWK